MKDLIAEKLVSFDYIVMLIYFAGIMAAFLVGIFKVCTKQAPLYFKLIVYGVGCRALEALATFVGSLCTGVVVYFRVSNLSVIAYDLFIISANSGTLDKFLDEKSSKNLRARFLALLAPVATIIIYGVFFAVAVVEPGTFDVLTVGLIIQFLPVPICAYFCMKQLLMPPDSVGFLKATRYVNIFILVQIVIELLSGYSVLISDAASNVCAILNALSFFGIVFGAIKGEKIWKTLV